MTIIPICFYGISLPLFVLINIFTSHGLQICNRNVKINLNSMDIFCEKIHGNLIISELDNNIPALSSLNYIQEVTGYISIRNVTKNILTFPNLKFINGHDTIQGYSLYIKDNYKESYNTIIGLQYVEFPQLIEISHGNVLFANNKALCKDYAQFILWKDVWSKETFSLQSIASYNNMDGFARSSFCRPRRTSCPKACTPPHIMYELDSYAKPSIYMKHLVLGQPQRNNASFSPEILSDNSEAVKNFLGWCWSPDTCQRITHEGCNMECFANRCIGPNPRQCCNAQCRGLCTNPPENHFDGSFEEPSLNHLRTLACDEHGCQKYVSLTPQIPVLKRLLFDKTLDSTHVAAHFYERTCVTHCIQQADASAQRNMFHHEINTSPAPSSDMTDVFSSFATRLYLYKHTTTLNQTYCINNYCPSPTFMMLQTFQCVDTCYDPNAYQAQLSSYISTYVEVKKLKNTSVRISLIVTPNYCQPCIVKGQSKSAHLKRCRKVCTASVIFKEEGCEIVLGNLIINQSVLMKISKLREVTYISSAQLTKWLGKIELITGYLHISDLLKNIDSLAFFSALEEIRGVNLDSITPLLSINNTSISSLSMSRLKFLGPSYIVITNNPNLCAHELTVDWEHLRNVHNIVNPISHNNSFIQMNNGNSKVCGIRSMPEYSFTCHKECLNSVGCWKINASDMCVACKKYVLLLSSDSNHSNFTAQCISDCPIDSGYFLTSKHTILTELGIRETSIPTSQAGYCIKCHQVCQSCQGPKETDCTKCKYNYPAHKILNENEFSKNSKNLSNTNELHCLKNCPPATFYNFSQQFNAMGQCVPCHPFCQTCTGYGKVLSDDQCQKCRWGEKRDNISNSTTCLAQSEKCDSGFYTTSSPQISNLVICQNCHSLCSTCIDASPFCTSCKYNSLVPLITTHQTFLPKTRRPVCVKECPPFYFNDRPSMRRCRPCPLFCSKLNIESQSFINNEVLTYSNDGNLYDEYCNQPPSFPYQMNASNYYHAKQTQNYIRKNRINNNYDISKDFGHVSQCRSPCPLEKSFIITGQNNKSLPFKRLISRYFNPQKEESNDHLYTNDVYVFNTELLLFQYLMHIRLTNEYRCSNECLSSHHKPYVFNDAGILRNICLPIIIAESETQHSFSEKIINNDRTRILWGWLAFPIFLIILCGCLIRYVIIRRNQKGYKHYFCLSQDSDQFDPYNLQRKLDLSSDCNSIMELKYTPPFDANNFEIRDFCESAHINSKLKYSASRVTNNPCYATSINPSSMGTGIESKKFLKIAKKDDITLSTLIGSGAFGTVYKGYLKQSNGKEMVVAIKVLNDEDLTNKIMEIMEEMYLLFIVKHPNLLDVIAICLQPEFLILTEFIEFGSVLDFLRICSKTNINMNDCNNTTDNSHNSLHNVDDKKIDNVALVKACNEFCQAYLSYMLIWARQIAQGMAYLEGKSIVHRDLAARNILAKNIDHVIISDFGSARLINAYDDVYKSRGGKMPFKWLALETIETLVFTHKSDVWAYGITLWEIFSWGQHPYNNANMYSVLRQLKEGYRLERPICCPDYAYQLIRDCWHEEPNMRPNFLKIEKRCEFFSSESPRVISHSN